MGESDWSIERSACQFRDEILESEFRLHTRPSDKFHAGVVVAFFCLVNVAFIASDHLLFEGTSTFIWLLIARLAFVATSATCIYIVFFKSIQPNKGDRIMAAWWVLGVSLMCVVNLTRPATYTHHTAVDVLLLFSALVLVPNRFRLQVLSGVASVVAALSVLHLKDVSVLALRATLVSYALAMTLGTFIAWRLHWTRRSQFASWRQEARAREALEHALEEVRQLQGMLPMCASCKEIRNDKGNWLKIEAYLAAHTDVKFTHTLCAPCVERLYPDLDD